MTSVFREELIMEAPLCQIFRQALQPCRLEDRGGTGNGRIEEQALVVKSLGKKDKRTVQ